MEQVAVTDELVEHWDRPQFLAASLRIGAKQRLGEDRATKRRACSTERTSAEPSLKELADRIANTAKPAADGDAAHERSWPDILADLDSLTETESNRTASIFSCARRRAPPPVSPCVPPASPCRPPCASSPTPDPTPSTEM